MQSSNVAEDDNQMPVERRRVTILIGRFSGRKTIGQLINASLRAKIVPFVISNLGPAGFSVSDASGTTMFARMVGKHLETTTDPKMFTPAWGRRASRRALELRCDPGVQQRKMTWVLGEKDARPVS